jgi:hypothetical protein
MMEGASLQASPSTCMGMVLVVIIRADLHWVMQVPCPPACSSGCNPVHKYIYMYFNLTCKDKQVPVQRNPRFIISVGGPQKERWIRENER